MHPPCSPKPSRALGHGLRPIGLVLHALSVNADVDTGVQAYKDEDYPTAYTEFLAAAVAGNAVAQYLVGSMHEDGLGTGTRR